MLNISRPFIQRPVATALLTLGLALAGIVAFWLLPVARLPAVDMPTLSVTATLSGASPADMARTVATPLERTLGTIAGVTEMTSNSSSGRTEISLQFELGRDIDSAAREVQAAIVAAKPDLPASLREMPTWRKRNPAAQPFLILALTSDTLTPGQMYDAASTVLSQRLLQVPGVGDVNLGGGSLPAVRVALNPLALDALGVSGEDVRAALQASNANRPKGVLETGDAQDGRALQVLTAAPGLHAADYRDLIVAQRSGNEVRLKDVADVTDSVQNLRTRGMFNGKPAVVVSITQQPGANLIATADAIHALLPQLRAQLPTGVTLEVATDRTGTIRASVLEVEITLVIAVALVVLVVGLFLRNLRAALIPAVATVVSLLGAFGAMYALGFSLNNLTLMALTVATGFVVDDAIVVLENISRHIEQGKPRRQAALEGAREVGFTVLTISLSLVAVFIPLLFMGGVTGLMFREFALTLSAAVMISLVVSLVTTPVMCALLLPQMGGAGQGDAPRQSLAGHMRKGLRKGLRGGLRGGFARASAAAQGALTRAYLRLLDGALAAPWLAVAALAVLIGLSAYMFSAMPKGYFPQQDTGQLVGFMRADQSISATLMGDKLQQAVDIVRADPAVQTVVGFSGGRGTSGGFLGVNLKPLGERTESSRQVIARLRPQLAQITGLQVMLSLAQELRMSGRTGTSSSYLYVLKSDNAADLRTWTLRMAAQMEQDARLADISETQSDNSVETFIDIDRDHAATLGVSSSAINAALYNAFGQRQVATLYEDVNQYAMVMEWQQDKALSPQSLHDVRVPVSSSAAGASANPGQRDASTGQSLSLSSRSMVPLSSFATWGERAVPNNVRHDGGELAATISFDLPEGVPVAAARQAVREAEDAVGLPNNVRGQFAGAASESEGGSSEQVWLIVAAIVVIYIVLGMLYESLIHPLTVLTTLPSAGFGAALALLAMNMEFSIMALIGVFLLIGIVKKNAILIIDFALQAEREQGLSARDAVRQACIQRFRPILMTSLAAGLGALPLAIGFGQGGELRQPLGVTIIGGLIASQLITLLTTPAVYLLLDKLRRRPPVEITEKLSF